VVATATLAVALSVLVAGTAWGAHGGTSPPHGARAGAASPYRDDGMWIWYVSRSNGGDLDRIARKAHRKGIETLYIKSSDGSNAWSQFNRAVVSHLHRRHLRVCAWQFVYGAHPGAEARRGAPAGRRDAE
jgi:hypothetical protein